MTGYQHIVLLSKKVCCLEELLSKTIKSYEQKLDVEKSWNERNVKYIKTLNAEIKLLKEKLK